jgi:hypothetical protein
VCVVGIDFGTARTGYGYAFPAQGSTDPDIIVKEPGGQEAAKTLTNVLLDSRGNFQSFGKQARKEHYEDGTGLFFENFKMQLHESARRPTATSASGENRPLMDVIVHTLRYVKDQAMATINSNQPMTIAPSDCRWVVTVPAIWKDVAKGFMREAACKAGLASSQDSDLLALVLEPEAACVACEAGTKHLKTGDAFMVLDCGGGTIDITLHQVKTTNPLSVDEIAPPSGGPWGSTYVDRKFTNFVEDLIGTEKMIQFKQSSFFVELMDSWENVKTSFDINDARAKSINLSPLLEVMGSTNSIKEVIDEYNAKKTPEAYICPISTSIMSDPVVTADGNTYDRQGIERWFQTKDTSPLTNERLSDKTLRPNRLLRNQVRTFTENAVKVRGKTGALLPAALIAGFFDEVITFICGHVTGLVSQHPQLKYIYLAGGFAESQFLHDRVRAKFEKDGRKVIVPLRPGTAVIRGAVMLGVIAAADPSRRFFASRRARFTYGTRISVPYQPRLHAGRHVDTKHNGDKMVQVFRPLVKAGDSLLCDQKVESEQLFPYDKGVESIYFALLVSTSTDPQWPDDPTVAAIGSITLPCSYDQHEHATLSMEFGSTEIKSVAKNGLTGAEKRATLEYNFNSA